MIRPWEWVAGWVFLCFWKARRGLWHRVVRGGVRFAGPRGEVLVEHGTMMGDGSSSRLFEVWAPPLFRLDLIARRLWRRVARREGALGEVRFSLGSRSARVRVVEVDRRRFALANVPDPDLPTSVSRAMTPEESRAMDDYARRVDVGRRRMN
jgi:hypothetical protein